MPYKMREEVYKKLLPAENALVKTAALIMWGRTLIPARFIAMTYGLPGKGGEIWNQKRAAGNIFTSEPRYRLLAATLDHYRARAYL